MPTRPTPADDPRHDLSPWTETPSSSRVSRFRYDHATKQIQCQWTNMIGTGYVYDLANDANPYESFRLFARAVSKGRKINTMLNGYPYRPMTPDEYTAPSNPNRSGLQSRVEG